MPSSISVKRKNPACTTSKKFTGITLHTFSIIVPSNAMAIFVSPPPPAATFLEAIPRTYHPLKIEDGAWLPCYRFNFRNITSEKSKSYVSSIKFRGDSLSIRPRCLFCCFLCICFVDILHYVCVVFFLNT